jgi:assimilatory nitrate reductase catalytic subunit
MASSVAGHRRAFGADAVPGCYEDLDLARLIVFVGSNAAWCHPVLYRRVRAAKEADPNVRIVVIDPRATATRESADLHLALRPGSDAWLFNGLLHYLREAGCTAESYVSRHTSGAEAALDAAARSAGSIAEVANRCALDPASVASFYRLFAETERTVTLYSQGVNQSSSGTDKVNAIINCHLLTGRIGRPGMGPLSLTGQPNAMGGREAGGLANQLAAHMVLENPVHRERVRRFWGAPTIATQPGLKAVDLFEAIHRGDVRAVWIMGTNPVVSLPGADRAREALRRCPLVVVSDCHRDTDTADLAQILLPALAWGEKEGTVTNSERRISRQRAFLRGPGEARADWWALTQVARRMGFASAFPYETAHEIFREHAALSGFENGGGRVFDLSGLRELSPEAYRELNPIQWPVLVPGSAGTPRLYSEGGFTTPDGRARFVAVQPRLPVYGTDAGYPLTLNTGRLRDQWHTMTRTGRTATLCRHGPEPFAELHPDDAAPLDIADGQWVRLESRWGRMVTRARLDAAHVRGSVFVPIHWTAQFASAGRVGTLVNPSTDPVSGQPEFKQTPVRVEPLRPAWQGVLFSRGAFAPPEGTEWIRVRAEGFWRTLLAGFEVPGNWETAGRSWLDAYALRQGVSSAQTGSGADATDWVSYYDRSAGRFRIALLVKGRLEACLIVGTNVDAIPERWWEGAFASHTLGVRQRSGLLTLGAGENALAHADPLICSCNRVARSTILNAARQSGVTRPEDVGRLTGAGTGCGSCLPEIRTLLARAS